MKNENITELSNMIEKELTQRGISRRDALKLAGVGSAAFMLNPKEAQAATQVHASGAQGKIVIIGGGFAGISVAARLASTLSNPDITIIEPNDKIYYQPGYTLIASGVYGDNDTTYNTKDFIPDGVKWIQAKAVEFMPEENKLKTSDGKTVDYDYMVVAAGLTLNYEKIEGLTKDKIGKNGVASIYFLEGAQKTWRQMQEFVNKGGEGLFTHPNTPIKCGGAPKKIQFLTVSHANNVGKRDNINTTFLPNGGAMFGVKEYHDAIVGFYEERNMDWDYKHNLVAIDTDAKKATFEHSYQVKGNYDEILEEYEMVTKKDRVVKDYDFIHVTPPMEAPAEIGNSPIGSAQGWIPVEKETMQHINYKNIFALGDIAAVPMGKTGGSVRKQAPIVVENLVATMEGKAMPSKYDGYTVCPLITEHGKVAMLEFDWSKQPKPSFPLDPSVDRWVYWVMKVYMLKPMTMYGMLKGMA